MTDLDKMAREMLAAELRRRGLGAVARAVVNGSYDDEPEHSAIRAALLTAPPGYVLVPVEPTPEMVASAREHHEGSPYLPIGLYRAMIAAAPEVKP